MKATHARLTPVTIDSETCKLGDANSDASLNSSKDRPRGATKRGLPETEAIKQHPSRIVSGQDHEKMSTLSAEAYIHTETNMTRLDWYLLSIAGDRRMTYCTHRRLSHSTRFLHWLSTE